MSSPEALLEHATWLRRLAASLVGDPANADDLVQDTWVAALRRPPDLERPVRPWLARVVRNAARLRWRGETNRARREQAIAAEGEPLAPSSDELLARHALQQQLARLVGELAEPFRAAILLRYAEGLAPAEIARQQGIPASTVRGRIQEGLERLRRGLDEAHDGNRKTWLILIAPIALWPRASRAAPAGIGVAVALAVVGVVAIFAIGRRSHTAMLASASSVAPRPAATRAAGSAVVGPPVHAQEGAPSRRVAGRVVKAGAPVANALVRLVADAAAPIEQRTGDDGRFDFGTHTAEPVTLGAGAPETLGAIAHLDLRDPTARPDALELELLPCVAGIEGRVTDAGGNPIAHAQLLREDAIGSETDANGAYALCTRPTAPLVAQLDIVVRADGYGTIATGVAAAGRIHRDFTLVPEATITGTAVPGAAIWFAPESGDFGPTDVRPAHLAAATDADGRFRITGASDGPYRVGGSARGLAAVGMRVVLAAGTTTDVTVRMVGAAIVHGVVTANGVPVAGARVAVVPPNTWGVVAGHDDPRDEPIDAGDAVTQADGTFAIDHLPIGPAAFSADPLRVVSGPVALIAGDNHVAIEAVSLGRIRGVVRRHGVAVPYARIDFGGATVRRGLDADGAGRFELAGLEPGTYGFYADDQRRGAFFAGEFPPLGDGETLEHDIELAWGASISGTVVDAAKQPVAGTHVRFTRADGTQSRCTTDATGAFTCAALIAGTYVATVHPGDDASRPLPFVAPVAAIDVPDDGAIGNLRLAIDPRTAAIAGTVIDETGAPVTDAHLRAWGVGPASSGWVPAIAAVTDASGHFQLAGLAPGDYKVTAELLDGSRVTTEVIGAGASDARIELARPTCVTGAPLDPSEKPASPIAWDDRVELVGWDVPSAAPVGEPISIALVFRVTRPFAHAWRVFAHLDGAHRINADHDPLGGACESWMWQPGDVLVDRFTTTLDAAGSFALRVGFYRAAATDGDRIAWRDLALTRAPAALRADGEGVEIATITAH